MKRKKLLIFHTLLALAMFLFFRKMIQIIPYNGDDWYFIGSMRKPYPLWGVFNPSKVLPEVLEPLVGYVGAYVIYPIQGNYIDSLAIAQTICIVAFITAFFYVFGNYVKNKCKLDEIQSLLCEVFLIAGFLVVYKQYDESSYFGFWASDTNCYFNYIIPGIINAIIVMIMSENKDFYERYYKYSGIIKGLFWMTVYFAMFSSIQLNVILAIYCFGEVLRKIFSFVKSKNKGGLIKSIWIEGVILVLWLITLVYDMNGKRAGMLSSKKSFFVQPISEVFGQLKELLGLINGEFLLFSMVIIAAFLVIALLDLKKKNYELINEIVKHLYMIGACVLYIILLYAKTGGEYAKRPDSTWAVLFFAMLFVGTALGNLIMGFKVTQCILPLAIVMLFTIGISNNYRFVMPYDNDYKTCKAVNEYIIEQIVEAEESGKRYVEVKVPKGDDESNWPHPYNMAGWMQNTLYAHGIIEARIKIVFVPDEKVNEFFYGNEENIMEDFIDFEAK